MKLVFFGSGPLSATILEYVASHLPTIQIVAIVTKPEPARRHRSQANPVITVAQARQIPVLQPTDLRAAAPELRKLDATAGLLFAYGKILPPGLLAIFPTGILNIHPSLLPKHRGPSPIEATILAGDAEAGVSLMIIAEEMDAGPIIAQESFPINYDISKSELTKKLLETAQQLLDDHLIRYIQTQQPAPRNQDSTQASYCSLIKKTDGNLTPSQESAASFTRKVRAYSSWPGVRVAAMYNDRPVELSVRTAHIDSETSGNSPLSNASRTELRIQTKVGSVLLDEVQLPGKTPISGRDLINGGAFSLAAWPTESNSLPVPAPHSVSDRS